ncbi:uncharacterized protein B0H18DRAFT_974040 [Fomitopsis serialis]|uniref:uncharacterized protein n=1 Tax=Fomitopsis serialis TaxID=139415 RepID=UPI00200833CF|nr:uncharacterized protein B0H18DRAFT_974040 [Neoantrodia serialis]KAH9936489.1 hypothetical protein B0H18DRAFT_974040 [Neoantrodia serialis]
MTLNSDSHSPPLQFKGEIMDFDLGAEVDHRKRRRNRTTQSCLNCHTSKRKCDRKRPCQRCIQLGLTGLCVYEVDDPSLRDDPNVDEATRLRNRIAELESLVRELRGKPHPRWAEPNYCDGDANEKWHSRSSKRNATSQYPRSRDGLVASATSQTSSVKTEQPTDFSRHQLYSLSSSPGSPGSHEEISASQAYYRSYAQQQPHGEAAVYYSPSSSSSPMGYDNGDLPVQTNGDHYSHHSYTRSAMHAADAQVSPCSCFNNPAAAPPLMALTTQLRTASHILRQLPEHHTPHECRILNRIVELDDIMHGGVSGYMSDSSYDTAVPSSADSEIMSPTSASSQSSLNTPLQEWPAMEAQAAYEYYPVPTDYQKAYHLAA